jgi:hypothetical protein
MLIVVKTCSTKLDWPDKTCKNYPNLAKIEQFILIFDTY